MWIKHNKALYNTNSMQKIEIFRNCSIRATFLDGGQVILGSFTSADEAEGIMRSITHNLLFDDPDHPGIIIKDTKETKK